MARQELATTGRSDAPASLVPIYDLAVWFERQPITAAQARATYVNLAADLSRSAVPSSVEGFVKALEACFPNVEHDRLPATPGARSLLIPAIRCECYVFVGGAYLSFPTDLAPDVTPLICHLADQSDLVVYDRQRQGVFLPSSIEISWKLRATAGDGFVVAHEPTAAEVPALLDAADQSDWFLILERDAEHYLQAAPEQERDGSRRAWTVEQRDGDETTHRVSRGASLDQVKQVFVLYAVGGSSWKDGLPWSPVLL